MLSLVPGRRQGRPLDLFNVAIVGDSGSDLNSASYNDVHQILPFAPPDLSNFEPPSPLFAELSCPSYPSDGISRNTRSSPTLSSTPPRTPGHIHPPVNPNNGPFDTLPTANRPFQPHHGHHLSDRDADYAIAGAPNHICRTSNEPVSRRSPTHIKSPTSPTAIEPRVIVATADSMTYYKFSANNAGSGEAIREMIFTALHVPDEEHYMFNVCREGFPDESLSTDQLYHICFGPSASCGTGVAAQFMIKHKPFYPPPPPKSVHAFPPPPPSSSQPPITAPPPPPPAAAADCHRLPLSAHRQDNSCPSTKSQHNSSNSASDRRPDLHTTNGADVKFIDSPSANRPQRVLSSSPSHPQLLNLSPPASSTPPSQLPPLRMPPQPCFPPCFPVSARGLSPIHTSPGGFSHLPPTSTATSNDPHRPSVAPLRVDDRNRPLYGYYGQSPPSSREGTRSGSCDGYITVSPPNTRLLDIRSAYLPPPPPPLAPATTKRQRDDPATHERILAQTEADNHDGDKAKNEVEAQVLCSDITRSWLDQNRQQGDSIHSHLFVTNCPSTAGSGPSLRMVKLNASFSPQSTISHRCSSRPLPLPPAAVTAAGQNLSSFPSGRQGTMSPSSTNPSRPSIPQMPYPSENYHPSSGSHRTQQTDRSGGQQVPQKWGVDYKGPSPQSIHLKASTSTPPTRFEHQGQLPPRKPLPSAPIKPGSSRGYPDTKPSSRDADEQRSYDERFQFPPGASMHEDHYTGFGDGGGNNGRQPSSSKSPVSASHRKSFFAQKTDPPEDMYNYTEDFFPDHHLDKPVIDVTPSGESSSTLAERPLPPSVPPPPSFTPLVHPAKKSIRVAANDRAFKIMTTAQKMLRKRNPKMWGSRLGEDIEDINRALKNAFVMLPPDSPSGVQGQNPTFKWIKGGLIGKGTHGQVFVAFNITASEMMAVKQVKLSKTASDRNDSRQKQAVDALISESDILKNLNHPNIVQYLGIEYTEDYLSIFLEYVPGGSIGDILRKHGKFDRDVVKSFTAQVVDGLKYLHLLGILHRNLKAGNILVNRPGICKISDFSISKRSVNCPVDGIYDDDDVNATMSIQSSIFWMAPEVLQNDRRGYNAKIDIWSLGCLLLEMWAGRRPWNQEDISAVIYKLGTSRVAPPVPDDVELSPVEDDFRCKCFKTNPNDRPTAAELRKHKFLELSPGWTFTGFTQL